MNRKILLTVLVLTAVLLATPLIGTVAAYDTNCHHDRWQKFDVAGSFSFLDILQADHKYYPSADNVEKLVMNWDENMVTYDITVGGITYSLGQDFTYSGHAEFKFYDPVFENPQLGNLYPTAFSALQERIVYKYDFSAVPGGLEGTIHLVATLENDVLTIRSLWGTRDFRDIKIRATATDTFDEATLTVNILHDGWVSGWPCVTPASMESTSITYEDLTAMCLAAGLPANPYPAPTVPVMTGPDENMIVHITGASAYYTFTQKIGCREYDGISCNVIDWSYNVVTLELHGVSKATWYLGKLGSLRSGFKGIVYENLYGYVPAADPTPESWDYITVNFAMLHGFGHFWGQGLSMYWDSRVDATTTGYFFSR